MRGKGEEGEKEGGGGEKRHRSSVGPEAHVIAATVTEGCICVYTEQAYGDAEEGRRHNDRHQGLCEAVRVRRPCCCRYSEGAFLRLD
jgi:hypothetical protein